MQHTEGSKNFRMSESMDKPGSLKKKSKYSEKTTLRFSNSALFGEKRVREGKGGNVNVSYFFNSYKFFLMLKLNVDTFSCKVTKSFQVRETVILESLMITSI